MSRWKASNIPAIINHLFRLDYNFDGFSSLNNFERPSTLVEVQHLPRGYCPDGEWHQMSCYKSPNRCNVTWNETSLQLASLETNSGWLMLLWIAIVSDRARTNLIIIRLKTSLSSFTKDQNAPKRIFVDLSIWIYQIEMSKTEPKGDRVQPENGS